MSAQAGGSRSSGDAVDENWQRHGCWRQRTSDDRQPRGQLHSLLLHQRKVFDVQTCEMRGLGPVVAGGDRKGRGSGLCRRRCRRSGNALRLEGAGVVRVPQLSGEAIMDWQAPRQAAAQGLGRTLRVQPAGRSSGRSAQPGKHGNGRSCVRVPSQGHASSGVLKEGWCKATSSLPQGCGCCHSLQTITHTAEAGAGRATKPVWGAAALVAAAAGGGRFDGVADIVAWHLYVLHSPIMQPAAPGVVSHPEVALHAGMRARAAGTPGGQLSQQLASCPSAALLSFMCTLCSHTSVQLAKWGCKRLCCCCSAWQQLACRQHLQAFL